MHEKSLRAAMAVCLLVMVGCRRTAPTDARVSSARTGTGDVTVPRGAVIDGGFAHDTVDIVVATAEIVDVPEVPVDGVVGVEIPDAGPLVPCERDADCTVNHRHGVCFSPGLFARYTQSLAHCPAGQAWKLGHPVGTCIYDTCGDGVAQCPDGMRCGTLDMVPFPQHVCVRALCDSGRDCRRASGGVCLGFLATGQCQLGGYACSYPSDPCVPRDPTRMCPYHGGTISFCAPVGSHERFVCVDEQPPLP